MIGLKETNKNNDKTMPIYLKLITLIAVMIFSTFILFACGEDNNKKVESIAISQTSISLVVGETEQLGIKIYPQSVTNADVYFSSADSSIATVDSNGLITAVSAGNTTITVTAREGGASAFVPVEVLNEPIVLDTPQNVSFDGEKVVWDRVDNNRGYEITINGVVYSQTIVTTFFTDFEAGVEYTISVKALGNGTSYLTSEASAEFKFMQLSTPSITIESATVKISAVPNATSFEILMNGQTHKQVYLNEDGSAQYIIEDTLEVGTYVFQVIAKGNIGNNVYDSKTSEPKTVEKLPAPTNAQIEDKILTFNNVVGASGYNLKIVNNETGAIIYQTINTEYYDLSNDGYEPGEYNIYIQSVGNNYTTLTSNYSTEFAIDKLSQPQNLRIENGRLSWDEVEKATGYILQIQFNGEIKVEENIPMPTFDFASKYLEAGEYFIQVSATGSKVGDENRYVNSSFSEGITVTKLSTPTNLQIKTNNILWDVVNNCQGYTVLLDESLVLPIQGNNYVNLNDTEFQTFVAKPYTVKIKAMGNGTNIIDSQYSASFSFKKLGTIDVNNITLNGSTVSWQSIGDAIIYYVYINGSETPISVAGTKIDFGSSSYAEGAYSITVQAISTANNAVNGEKSQPITFTKLPAPTNFAIENGVLTYSMPEGSSYLGYNLKVGVNEYNNIVEESLNFDQYIVDDDTVGVSLQAIGDGQNTISSNFSQVINIHKISSQVNLNITNDVLTWNAVTGATAYQIIAEYTNGTDTRTQTMEVDASNPTFLNLLTEEFFNEAGIFNISLKAMGVTTTVDSYDRVYDVNSNKSNLVSTRKLADIAELRVSSGLITWDAVEGVVYYEVFVDGESKGNCGTSTTYRVEGNSGAHSVRVYARGNKSTVLDANNADNTISVLKLTNVFQFSLVDATIMWQAIPNAYSYDIQIIDEENNTIQTVSGIKGTSYTIYGINDIYDKLYIKVRANGDNTYIVSGDFGAMADGTYYEVPVLSTPKNLRIVNSILYFDYVANAKVYELTISYNSIEDKQSINAIEGQTQGTFDLGAYLSGKNSGVYTLYMRSSDVKDSQSYLSSAYTTGMTVEKLGVPVITISTGEINFTTISNAFGYRLSVKGTADSQPTNIDLSRQDDSYIMGTRFVAGEYTIYIQALGDGTNTISSETSSEMSVVKLATPVASEGDNHDLEVKNGQIVWNSIPNASMYKFEVYRFDGIQNEYVKAYTNTLLPSANNSYLPSGSEGDYKITIQVIGDDTKYLSSDIYSYEKVLQKLKAPENIHISNGLISWNINAQAENGYSMIVNNSEFIVGSVDSYELTLESGFSGNVDYSIMLRTIGNSDNKLSSDLSDSINARKLATVILQVENGKVIWDKNSVNTFSVIVKSLDDEIVSSFETNDLTYALNGLDSGYYYVSVKAMGSEYVVDTSGYLNADFSAELAVYKMAKPQELKINSEFNAETVEELMRIGYLEWVSVENAVNYNVKIAYNTSIYREEKVDYNYYNIGANSLTVGKYAISVYSFGNVVINETGEFQCIVSDEATMDAYKLDTPTNLEAKNGVFYWDKPTVVEGTEDVELQYVFYYNYTEPNGIYNESNVVPIFTGDREFQTLFGVGTYKLSVCAVADNCIRSNIATLETDYNFDLFKEGDGSAENPYVIQTFTINAGSILEETRTAISQLEYINYLYDKHFILNENITIDKSFSSLGTKDELSFVNLDGGYCFEGTIDGNSYTITFNTGEENDQAFAGSSTNFGFVSKLGENGVIKKLNFSNFAVAGSYTTIGIVVAENYGTIDNVKVVSQSVGIISTFSGNNVVTYAGGIAGCNYATGKILNSTSQIIVNATNTKTYVYAGGIVGYNKGLIQNCRTLAISQNLVPIDRQIAGQIVGGIAGYSIDSTAIIDSCHNNATVDARANSGEYGSSSARAGGIVGLIDAENSVQGSGIPSVLSCYNTGSISALQSGTQTSSDSSKVGGIAGFISGGDIDSCYNVGDTYLYTISSNIQTQTRDNVGGIVGWNDDEEKSSVINSFFVDIKNADLQGIPSSCTMKLKNSDMNEVTEEELKADAIDENSILTKLNKYSKFKYNANGYPQLIWEA